MRKYNFTKTWRSIAMENTQRYSPAPLADQDILNALIAEYPEIVDRAHCVWNLQLGHKARPELCDSPQHAIKIVHWNSREKEFLKPLDTTAVYFSGIYRYFVSKCGPKIISKPLTLNRDVSAMETELVAQLSHNSRCVDRTWRRVETNSHPQREGPRDACVDIRRAPLLKRRLQPYLWPFDYNINNIVNDFSAQLLAFSFSSRVWKTLL